MIKFSIPIVLRFRTQQVFLRYLAKFQSVTNVRTRGFWTEFEKIIITTAVRMKNNIHFG